MRTSFFAIIKGMLDALDLGLPKFGGTYSDSQGKQQKCFSLPRDLTLTLIGLTLFSLPAQAGDQMQAVVSVCFTPAERCESKIVQAIDAATDTIKVQAFGFTSQPIIHALQEAAQRNVEVLAILDKSNEKRYSGSSLLQAAGIPVWIDYAPAIAHNKTIIIDGHLVIGGSFNYTKAAETKNAENVLFMDSAALAKQFTANWESRLAASRAFESVSPAQPANAE